MTDALRITVETNPAAADRDAVLGGLLAFNLAHLGYGPDEQPVAIFARDAHDHIVGGLVGHTRWRWLYVAKLWLHESTRGLGVGTRLMAAAESLARGRGCVGAYLDTLDYQARPFYEKLGYELFGTLDGFPPGHKQYFLAKRLDTPAPVSPADESATR